MEHCFLLDKNINFYLLKLRDHGTWYPLDSCISLFCQHLLVVPPYKTFDPRFI